MLTKYSSDSRYVEVVRNQIAQLESRRSAMESKHPDLAAAGSAGLASGPDLPSEAAKLKALEAKTRALKERMDRYQQMGRDFSSVAPDIAELERKKELEEANYKYFESNLEKARVDELLAKDSSKMPNISPVQKPSPASMVTGKKNKIMLGLAGGGLALGLGLAFLLEWMLDRTIKRPMELQGRLGARLLLAIPYLNGNRPALSNGNALQLLNGDDDGADGDDDHDSGNGNGSARNGNRKAIATRDLTAAPWETNHFIRKYCQSIRDRLIVAFQLRNMHHKPKLVAVAGVSKGAGASTIAAGLASALSETGEGKVLLVDMNDGEGQVHPFYEGRPSATLASILDRGGPGPKAAAENLYLATVNSPGSRNVPIGLRKFYSMMPVIKATDFDYVIFDYASAWGDQPHLGNGRLHGQGVARRRGGTQSGRNSPTNPRRHARLSCRCFVRAEQGPVVRSCLGRRRELAFGNAAEAALLSLQTLRPPKGEACRQAGGRTTNPEVVRPGLADRRIIRATAARLALAGPRRSSSPSCSLTMWRGSVASTA
jgi:hypothetical protein